MYNAYRTKTFPSFFRSPRPLQDVIDGIILCNILSVIMCMYVLYIYIYMLLLYMYLPTTYPPRAPEDA